MALVNPPFQPVDDVADDGKYLRVVDGAIIADDIPEPGTDVIQAVVQSTPVAGAVTGTLGATELAAGIPIAKLETDPRARASHTGTQARSTISDFAHQSTHASGGSDALTGNVDANARVNVRKAGTSVGTRRGINFIDGANATVTVVDDPANERVNVTIAATGGGALSPGLVGDLAAIDIGDSAAAGASGRYADAAHQHSFPAPSAPASLGGSAAAGTATTPARADHVHPYPTATQVGVGSFAVGGDLTGTVSAATIASGAVTLAKLAAAAKTLIAVIGGRRGSLAAETAGSSTLRWHNDTGSTYTVTQIRASVGTAPTGSAITVTVRKNGVAATTVTVAAAANSGTATGLSIAVADGEYLEIWPTAVGSTVAGADLVVTAKGTLA